MTVGLRQPKGTWQCTKKTLSLPPQSQQFGDSVGKSLIEGLPVKGKSRQWDWGGWQRWGGLKQLSNEIRGHGHLSTEED